MKERVTRWLAAKSLWKKNKTVEDDIKRLRTFSMLLLMGLLVLALFGDISTSVTFNGYTEVEGRNVDVTNRFDGEVLTIHVRNGERVVEGQPLFELSSNSVEIQRVELEKRLFSLLVTETRLEAELYGGSPLWDLLIGRKGFDEKVMDDAKGLYSTDLRSHMSTIATLDTSIESTRASLADLDNLLSITEEQIELLREDERAIAVLVSKGHSSSQMLRAITRARLDKQETLIRTRAELVNLTISLSQAIASREEYTNSQYIRLSQELTELRLEIQASKRDLDIAEDISGKLVIAAPVSGTITELALNSIGQIITKDKIALSIVPEGRDVIVVGRLPSHDRESITDYMPVVVSITNTSNANTSTYKGTIEAISADKIDGVLYGKEYTYFLVHVKVDSAEQINKPLTTGLPTSISIETGEVNILRYLLNPLLHTMDSSL